MSKTRSEILNSLPGNLLDLVNTKDGYEHYQHALERNQTFLTTISLPEIIEEVSLCCVEKDAKNAGYWYGRLLGILPPADPLPSYQETR